MLGGPQGTKRATSVNVQLPCLQEDLRTRSISRGMVDIPSELCRHRSGTCTEVARLVPPDSISEAACFNNSRVMLPRRA